LSLLSVYGFRASLVSFWFVSDGNCISHSKETAYEIMVQVCLMGRWFWYLVVSFFFSKICSYKDQNQLLSDTLLLIGEYLKLRATFKKTTRDEYLKQSFVLQHQINEKHETLRETLLTARKRSGRSHYEKATINTPLLY
jgi:hypothetical protein